MKQAGYFSNLTEFQNENVDTIIDHLIEFVPDASNEQKIAWKDSIKVLKNTTNKLLSLKDDYGGCSIVLEYTIPLEARRIDALLILNETVIVIEFKGKGIYTQGDVDQAIAYARDLKNYHSECSSIDVKCLLILTKASDLNKTLNNLEVLDPDHFTEICKKIFEGDLNSKRQIELSQFLSLRSYRPIPSLIKAARELFNYGNLERIHRSSSDTVPTTNSCIKIINNARSLKRKSLILINGVPGAGKTLVGLKLAHEDISNQSNGDPISVFLSGNGPLVEVLQYELRKAGGDGKAFVRNVHEYVSTFSKSSKSIPPHNVLIFDEAQRAFDAQQVLEKQKNLNPEFSGLSEPEIFIQFADRVPDWCVVIGLIGTGQEIHIGEEGGVAQWKDAIFKSKSTDEWDVYIPNSDLIINDFKEINKLTIEDSLNLSKTIRFHSSIVLYEFVDNLLKGNTEEAFRLSEELEVTGYNLRMTHNLDRAKQYIQERFADNNEARYGIVTSSRDKELNHYGINKGFKSFGEARRGEFGKWYSNSRGMEGSSNNFDKVITEFGVQGLELDFSLVAWGTDLIRSSNQWSNMYSTNYRDMSRIKDPLLLRLNAYRVLLTRGREGMVIYIPPIRDKMGEIYKFLKDCGFKELK